MSGKAFLGVFLVVFWCAGAGADESIPPSSVLAVASSVNYQLEAVYSCNGNGLTGELHTNNIGGEPPAPGNGTMWLSNGVDGQWIRYQFDQVYTLSGMWVWNYNQVTSGGAGDSRTERGIRDCTIDYSTDGITWGSLGGTVTLAMADGTNTYAHNTEVDLGMVEAKYIRINVIGSHGGSSSGLSEVRFFYAGAGVSFQTDSSGGPEYVATTAVGVKISEPMAEPVSVNYSVAGGTAVEGADYTLRGNCFYDLNGDGVIDYLDLGDFALDWLYEGFGSPVDRGLDRIVDFRDFSVLASEWIRQGCEGSTLWFQPGETVRDVYMEIYDDGAFNESDETVTLELSGATGGLEVNSPSMHTYTIMDSAPQVGFQAATGFALEDSGIIRVEVVLSQPVTQIVTVDCSVVGGTAGGGGDDYQLLTQTVVIDQDYTTGYVEIRLRPDNAIEDNETIELLLSNPTGAALGLIAHNIFTIIDDEAGMWFDNRRWYSAGPQSDLSLTPQGELEWYPDGGSQMITRLDEQPFNVGDVVEVSYIWTSMGPVSGCQCYVDLNPDPNVYQWCDDVTCIGGTGDFRVGLFDSSGQGFITSDNQGPNNDIFRGYKGFQYRIYPHVPQDARSRFSEPKPDGGTEAHTNTSMWDRSDPFGNAALLSNSNSWNRMDQPMTGGFGLPVGQGGLVTMRLERTGSNSARVSIASNGKTWTKTSSLSSSNMPAKIDTLAMWSNGGSYEYVRLGTP